MQQRIQVWDWPVRVFHWSMVLVVAGAIATGLIGGNAMEYHGQLGVALSGLLGFRLAWGVVGTRTARFISFVRGPQAILQSLRGQWRGIGHNPLGALSVLALLGVFGFQAVSGLFTNDDIAFNGPLRKLVSKEFSDIITGIHHSMLPFLIALIVLHVGAIMFYRVVKKEDLVRPMLRGWKPADADAARQQNSPLNWLALIIAMAVGIGCAVLASGIWMPAPAPVPVSTPAW
ncbi:MAG: cytochrome b/b6 domain-containing protein [Gammaproteobacteria bacterium]